MRTTKRQTTPATTSKQPTKKQKTTHTTSKTPTIIPRKIPNPKPTTLTVKQGDIWDDLHERHMVETRFLCPTTLEKLGMLDVVKSLLKNVGLEDFMGKGAHTYRRYTLEFLSTLSLSGASTKTPKITFRLKGQPHSMTYAELRKAFGIKEMSKVKYVGLDKDSSRTWWKELTGLDTNDKQGELSSYINHPCLRVAHRLIANTFLCKGDPTKLPRVQFGYLWAMTPEGVGVPDWVDLFVQSCLKLGTNFGAKIGGGGLVTLIMQHLKIGVDEDEIPLMDSYLLNVPCLIQSHMLRPRAVEGTYFWCWGSKNDIYLKLPRPVDDPLTYGEVTEDFHICADPDLDPLDDGESDEDDEEDEGDGARSGIDDTTSRPITTTHVATYDQVWIKEVDAWRKEVDAKQSKTDDKLEALNNVLLETRELVRSLVSVAKLGEHATTQDVRKESHASKSDGNGDSSGT